jgi:LuxR family maltose regulon positive regulatory protein
LRKMLVYPRVVQLAERTISIDRGLCWVDAWALERRLAEKDAATAGKDKGQGVLQLYGGTFLPDDVELPWTHSLRERLRGQFLRYVAHIGKSYEDAGDLEAATLLYQKGIEADNLAEELYQGLMRCHIQQERRAEAMAVYRRLRQTLSVTLSVQPSPRSELLFKTIQGC